MKASRFFKLLITATVAVTAFVTSAFALYPAKVQADALYLRSGASSDSEVIDTLSQNTVVGVISNTNKEWYTVVVNGKIGYVSAEYLIGTSFGDFSLGTAQISCDTTVNLRQSPNTSAPILASLQNNETVQVVGIYSGWYKVTANEKTGFVHPDYVQFSNTTSTIHTVNVSNPTEEFVTIPEISDTRKEVLTYAATFLGTPYVYGGNTPSGFDCSGFTSYVFANTVTSIPRVAQSQFDALTHVSREELLPGDLVFFGSSPSSISHVGIYIGDNQFIHSPRTGDVVKYDSLSENYDSRFQGGARVIFD